MNNLIGRKFGRLTVTHREKNNRWGNLCWMCECNCGQKIVVRGNNLVGGNTKSCGCLQKEKTIASNIRRTIHGHSRKDGKSRIYETWRNMVQRCTDTNYHHYRDYGGRGITVCERWIKFENFLKDMGERPTTRHSVERINNNKGYYKENCRWATRKQQARNRRNNHLETHNGKTQCLEAWAEELGISSKTIRWRFKHWSIEKALTTPVRKKEKSNGRQKGFKSQR